MYIVNYKEKKEPQKRKLVKIEMVFYWESYSRITLILKEITGLYKDWDNKSQSFLFNSEENQGKNLLLFELRDKHLKVALEW